MQFRVHVMIVIIILSMSGYAVIAKPVNFGLLFLLGLIGIGFECVLLGLSEILNQLKKEY